MSRLLDDDRYLDMDPASVRMLDLALDRLEEPAVVASDDERPAWNVQDDDDAYGRDEQ